MSFTVAPGILPSSCQELLTGLVACTPAGEASRLLAGTMGRIAPRSTDSPRTGTRSDT